MFYVIVHCSITKVFKITKNLEHNNYAHVTNALRIVTLASHAFLVQDVVEPPPALLSLSIDMYASQVLTCSTCTLIRPHAACGANRTLRLATDCSSIFAYEHMRKQT